MNKLKKIKIGIMPLDQFQQYTIDLARGKRVRKKSEPKIWFSSIKSLAHVLSEQNQALLRLIIEEQPQSISDLEPLTGRKANNILRTLRLLEQYGFVKLVENTVKSRGRPRLVPKVLYDSADIELNFA